MAGNGEWTGLDDEVDCSEVFIAGNCEVHSWVVRAGVVD